MTVDQDVHMELLQFNEIMKASGTSKASWIGAVNLLEAAAAAEYRGRKAAYCRQSHSLHGGWDSLVRGEVCYLLDKQIKVGEKLFNERWFVVFHAGDVFESRYDFKERCRAWTDDLEKWILPRTSCSILPHEYAWLLDRHNNLQRNPECYMTAHFPPLPILQPCRKCMKLKQKQQARHIRWLEKVNIVNSKLRVHGEPSVMMQSMAMSLFTLGPTAMQERIANLTAQTDPHELWKRVCICREEEMQAQFAFQNTLTEAEQSEYKFKYGWKRKCHWGKFWCKQSKFY